MADVRHVTVEGIELDVDMERLDDYEAVEVLADMMDADPAHAAGPYVRWIRLVLGDDYGRVKTELRAAHGGRLKLEDMDSFCSGVIEEAGAKN